MWRFACIAAVVFALTRLASADGHYLPLSVISAGLEQAGCEISPDEATEEDPQDLGGGLKLVQVSCWRAAYNFGSILFVVSPGARDKARLLSFQTSDGKAFNETYDLNLPDYNAKTRTLSSFFKGRGVGDCGSIGAWRWTGSEFSLTDYWLKDDCDGEIFDIEHAGKWRVYPVKK